MLDTDPSCNSTMMLAPPAGIDQFRAFAVQERAAAVSKLDSFVVGIGGAVPRFLVPSCAVGMVGGSFGLLLALCLLFVPVVVGQRFSGFVRRDKPGGALILYSVGQHERKELSND